MADLMEKSNRLGGDPPNRYDATRFSRIKRLRHAPHFRPRFQYVENSASTTPIYINIDGESYRKTFLWLVCSVAKVTHRSPHPLQRPNKFAGWAFVSIPTLWWCVTQSTVTWRMCSASKIKNKTERRGGSGCSIWCAIRGRGKCKQLNMALLKHLFYLSGVCGWLLESWCGRE